MPQRLAFILSRSKFLSSPLSHSFPPSRPLSILQVGPDRMQKLQNVLEKIFGRFGTIVRRYYPVDEATQMFKGYGIEVTVFCMYVCMYCM